jgi:hypothetical protein
VEVLGQIHGHLVALRLPVTVIDLGPTGFAIETPVPFPDRAPHSFRFKAAPDFETIITAVSVRSARLDRPQQPPAYITGFEFVFANDAARASVNQLMDTIVAFSAE